MWGCKGAYRNAEAQLEMSCFIEQISNLDHDVS